MKTTEIARRGERIILDVPSKGRFEIREADARAGVLEYVRRSRLIALTHTKVDAAHEGRGIGGDLVAATLGQLRSEGAVVLPFCSFVSAYIARHPEYVGLVPEGLRGDFGL